MHQSIQTYPQKLAIASLICAAHLMVTTSNLIFILSKPSGQSRPDSLRCCTTATFVLVVGLFILHPHKVRRRSLQSSSVFGLVAFLLLFSRPSLILVILANATSSHLKPRRPPLSPSSPPHSSSSSAQAEDPVRVSAFLPFSTNSQLERRCRATGLPPSRERRCVGSTRQRTYCLRGGIPLPLKGNRAPALNLACKKIENIYLNLRPPSAPSSCRL